MPDDPNCSRWARQAVVPSVIVLHMKRRTRSCRGTVVPYSRLAVGAKKRCPLCGLFYRLLGELVYFGRNAFQVENLPSHETIDVPVESYDDTSCI